MYTRSIRVSTAKLDLQEPPKNLPLCAPKLAAIVPGDIPKWEEKWKKFLFGHDVPEYGKDRKWLDIKRIGPKQEANGVKLFYLNYRVDEWKRAEAHLLLPNNLKGRLPGVVVFHETNPIHNPWKAAGSLDPRHAIRSGSPEEEVVKDSRYIAVHLALKKYAVIVPKCFIFTMKRPSNKDPWDFMSAVNDVKTHHQEWKGLSQMILEGMRAVDALREQPEVDRNRIGVIGHSLGGKQVPYVMAFDPRINAGVSSDGGIGLCFSNWEKDWYLGPEIRYREFENNQILALIAPQAFLLVGGEHDDDRGWPFIAGAMPLWKAKKYPKKIGWYRHNKGHCWPKDAQKVAYRFLDQYLKKKRR